MTREAQASVAIPIKPRLMQIVSNAEGQQTDHDDGQQSERYVALDRTQVHA